MLRKSRRQINSSGKAFCEICQEEHFLVQHHISGRKVKNPNNPNNLANICSNCHLKIHKAEIIVEKRIMSSSGFILIWHKAFESSITGEDSNTHIF